MVNYKTITDYDELTKFIEWLPELQQGECFYYSLIAREKYLRGTGIGTFNSDKHQPARFVTNKERLVTKLKQTECPLGSYNVKGLNVPQEALASYITVNPRSHVKAAKYALKRLADVVADGEQNPNVYQESLTALHKSVGRKLFTDIDFDISSESEYKAIFQESKKIINPDAVTIIFTRGGFHALIRLDMIEQKYVKSWYQEVSKLPGVDIKGDVLTPIPGTYQGGYTPRMFELKNL